MKRFFKQLFNAGQNFLGALAFAVLVPAPAQAMKFFVDNTLGEVRPEEKVRPATTQPVQVLFEFQRDGVLNAAATKQIKPLVIDAIKTTGNFSEVTDAPTANGAVLSIRFNNLVSKEDLSKAKKDGFKAGLSFGLASGFFVTDNYEVTFEYLKGNGADPIKTMVLHKLHTTFGKQKAGFVAPGTAVKKINDALKMVVNQAIARGVNTVVTDTRFPN